MTDQESRRFRARLEAARALLAQRRQQVENSADATEVEPVRVVLEQEPPAEEADRGHPVPSPVRAVAEWSWRVLVIAAAVALIGWLAWQLRLVVFPVAVAVLLAALLYPPVRWLRTAGWNRGLAAATVFIGFLAVIGGSLTLVGNAISGQFEEVIERVEEGLVELQEWFAGPPFYLTEEQIQSWVDSTVQAFGQAEGAIAEGAVSTAVTTIEVLAGVILTLFALLLLLYDGERIWAWTVGLFPRRTRARVAGAGQQAWLTITSYVRGTTLVALFDAFFITILLLVLGVPLALALGVLVFFGAFVPLVGAFVAGGVAVLVALVANGLVTAVIVLIGIIAIQQIEGNVFQPLVLSKLAKLHPLAVVAAITVGLLVAGIIGGVVAVPIVAMANSVGKYLASPASRPAAEADLSANQDAKQGGQSGDQSRDG